MLWGAVVRDRELIKSEVSDQEITAVTRAATPNTALFLGAIVLAIIAPEVAAFGYLVSQSSQSSESERRIPTPSPLNPRNNQRILSG